MKKKIQTLDEALRSMSTKIIVFGYFPIDVILHDHEFPQFSRTLRLLRNKDQRKCVRCEIEGTVFIHHRHQNEMEEQIHLDLFAQLPSGGFRMMTVDHILPKSKGGTGWQSNLQLMCDKCNMKRKGNIISYEEWDIILSDFSKHVHFPNRDKWKKFVRAYYTDFPELDLAL